VGRRPTGGPNGVRHNLWVASAPTAPSARNLDVFLAVVEHSSLAAAGHALRPPLSARTVRWHLATLYDRLGVSGPDARTRAAVILWPILRDRYRLPPGRLPAPPR
jgi:hypothetical protein